MIHRLTRLLSQSVNRIMQCSARRISLVIFIISLIIAAVGYSKFASAQVYGDAALHKRLGSEVASGIWLTSEDFGFGRAPGYPFILGAIYSIFGDNDLPVKLLQIIVFSINAVLIFNLGSLLYNNIVGVFSAVWYVTYYDFVMFACLLMREIWIVFFILLTFLCFILYVKKHRVYYIVFASLSFGYLIMVDPRYSFFLFVLLLVGVCFSGTWRRKILVFSVILLCMMLFLVPWAVRQSSVYGKLVILSLYWDAEIVSFVSGKGRIENKELAPIYEERIEYLEKLSGTGLSPSTKSRLEEELTDDYIQALRSRVPSTQIQVFAHRFLDYWRFARFRTGVAAENDLRYRFPWPLSKNINNIIHIGFLLPFIVVGFCLSLMTRMPSHILLLSFFIYHLFFHVLVQYLYRYRLPILPILFLFGWYGVYNVTRKLLQKRTKSK